jgi:membrane-associated phospholipid phosphatase
LLINELTLKHLAVDLIGFEPRPYVAHPDTITPVGKLYADTSFPSDHVASTVMILTIIVCLFPAFWPFAIVFALMIMFSRIHNGMHYPLDVLA